MLVNIHHFPDDVFSKVSNKKRIICIANNKDVSIKSIHDLKISNDDIVIQFNDAIYNDVISDYECLKIYVFRQTPKWGFYRGFPVSSAVKDIIYNNESIAVFTTEDEQPEQSIQDLVEREFIGISDVYTFNIKSKVGYFSDLPIMSDGKKTTPTTGYLIMRLFYEFVINNKLSIDILAVGFSGSPKGVYFMHNLDFERIWLSGSGVKLIQHSQWRMIKRKFESGKNRLMNYIRLFVGKTRKLP